MAAQLLIGTLDLSTYLDLAPGDGTDPAAPSYSQRVIGHSLLREGGTFAFEDSGVKELVFPLYLKAATKDALHALVQTINLALEQDGQTATWTDDSASQPTVFDLATGQLDVSYDFRRAQNRYLHATLKLYAQPFGRTTAPRVIATLAGTGPVITLSTPSAIRGDVPAFALASTFGVAVEAGGGNGVVTRLTAFSVLPNASYTPLFNASAFQNPGTQVASTIGASGAVASLFRRMPISSQAAQTTEVALGNIFLFTSDRFPGNQRVLMIARPAGPTQWFATAFSQAMPTIPVWISDDNGNTTPIVGVWGGTGPDVPVPTAWQVYDMGVVNVDPTLEDAVIKLGLWTTKHPTPSYALDVTGIVLLPEANTIYVADQSFGVAAGGLPNYGLQDPAPTDTYFFNGASARITRWPQYNLGKGWDVTRYSRGMIPAIPAGPSGARMAIFAWGGVGNEPLRASVAVQERTRFVF
jgi:hypothetical protein